MRIPLAHIAARANEQPEGYTETLMEAGIVDGTDLVLTDRAYEQFCAQFAKPRGLGDLVASIARPIARAVDAVLGTDLENCGSCAQRQEDWNVKFPLR